MQLLDIDVDPWDRYFGTELLSGPPSRQREPLLHWPVGLHPGGSICFCARAALHAVESLPG